MSDSPSISEEDLEHRNSEGPTRLTHGVSSDGKVVIQFPTEVKWLGLHPGQAEDMAETLLYLAKQARQKRGEDPES